ncbi:unnamed protein product, partial [Oikopleura dioica]
AHNYAIFKRRFAP